MRKIKSVFLDFMGHLMLEHTEPYCIYIKRNCEEDMKIVNFIIDTLPKKAVTVGDTFMFINNKNRDLRPVKDKGMIIDPLFSTHRGKDPRKDIDTTEWLKLIEEPLTVVSHDINGVIQQDSAKLIFILSGTEDPLEWNLPEELEKKILIEDLKTSGLAKMYRESPEKCVKVAKDPKVSFLLYKMAAIGHGESGELEENTLHNIKENNDEK